MKIAASASGKRVAEKKTSSIELKGGDYVVVDSRGVEIAHSDKLIAAIPLSFTPQRVLLSSQSKVMVALGCYGINAATLIEKRSVKAFDLTGKKLFALKLDDICSDATKDYSNELGSIFWLKSAWIDDDQGELLILFKPRQGRTETDWESRIRAISLLTGKVRNGNRADVIRAVHKQYRDGLSECLDLAREVSLEISKKELLAIFRSNQVPVGARVRAALVLAKDGDSQAKEFILRVATSESEKNLGVAESEWLDTIGFARDAQDILGKRGK